LYIRPFAHHASRSTSRSRGRGRTVRLGVLLLTAGCLAACSEPGDPRGASAVPTPSGPGEVLFAAYCAGCHGADGRGGAAAASALRRSPPDLTTLWKRYGTPLDREALAGYIDGRWLGDVHGRREMPIWGRELFAEAPPATPGLESTRARLVAVLVDHLQSIQTEQGT